MFCDDKKGTNSKNVDWKQNRAVFFARKERETWHSFESDGISTRVAVVYNLMTTDIKNVCKIEGKSFILSLLRYKLNPFIYRFLKKFFSIFMNNNTLRKFFKNKKVIITGHTGFKGSWLALWLNLLGAKVLGLSSNFPTNPCHFKLLNLKKILSKKIDIRNFKLINKEIKSFKPDYVFHLAAQAIVKKSYSEPLETFSTNLIGTLNILESLSKIIKKQFLL